MMPPQVICPKLLLRAAIAVGLSAYLSGCMVGPDFSRPATQMVDQYKTPAQGEFTDAVQTETSKTLNPVAWWESFNDPTLTKLLKQASGENITLQSAAVRIYQARSALGVADATLLPTVGLGGTAQQTNQPSILSQFLNASSTSAVQNVVVSANWEIDFWGKFRRGIESALASYQSAVATYYAADVSLAAEVANTYVNIRYYEQSIEVARANLILQAESLRIAGARYRYGATSLLDLSQAQSQYEQTKSMIPPLVAGLQKAQNAMSILLGKPPEYYDRNFGSIKGTLTPPAALQVGIPKDLLRRRPDILQAEYYAASQSALIGVNAAALYPSFSLAGYFGFQTMQYTGGPSMGPIFTWDNRTTNIGASFTFPLFYRGAIYDQIRVQDAVFQQAILNYQNLVLKAQQEVDDSLILISTSRSASADLVRAVTAAQQAAALALDRYKQGQNDYNTVIVAQQQLLQVQESLVQSNSNILLGYVSAFKALGGGWSGELDVPNLPGDVIDQMQQRTNWGTVLVNNADPRLVKPSETTQ